jgi:hypothetical protein
MKTMDHQQAVTNQAAEKYFLDELSPQERDDFEEHYFSCVECADEVRATFSLADNAKAVLAEAPARPVLVKPAPVKERRSFDWLAWLRPTFAVPVAATVLLAVTLYQSAQINRLRHELSDASAPRVVTTAVAHAATRGEETVIRVADQDRLMQLILDINPTSSVSSYTCEVWDSAGNMRFAVPVNVMPDGASVYLLLPAQGLSSGKYSIRVRPAGSSVTAPLEEYRFEVQRK